MRNRLQSLVNPFFTRLLRQDLAGLGFRQIATAAEEGKHPLGGVTKSKKQDLRPVSEEYRTGAKSVLFTILKNADEPLTTAEIWEAAENEGLKSKRFMKQMLLNMKKARHITARPSGKGNHFGYILPSKLNPPKPHVPWPGS
ncbi:hypothetical protein COCSUDRAFT_52651 [Coccomyxa subellipsoidea C-169]|uniref:HTH HARE-type domain-containing protein n=1 Tax=Coccomyxa subellipsoidea (strain C-169) TaxID=574566 RepID=I0Z5U1_COCSC|nr:hypothetical protein COCSUDRAFT_52651 [Coccomyxa subellipsoidea C-169]EIE26010.1 hypothetical protein COCSUDRAFT_52651 [Coccomyxa subellipsoidea C-169]|eukprot:XP_005650554.1 hypothetical protein COCSUDRAFT_52651 [Coccomyxa subellipsoidea C-169]